jgi:hypothetical protein
MRYLYDRAQPSMTPKSPSVIELLRLGILIPAADGAAAAASAVMPVLNPRLFIPRDSDPRDGT